MYCIPIHIHFLFVCIQRDTLTICQEPDSNWWHEDFQSSALPAELSRPSSIHYPTVGHGSVSIHLKVLKKHYKSWDFFFFGFFFKPFFVRDMNYEWFNNGIPCISLYTNNTYTYVMFVWTYTAFSCWSKRETARIRLSKSRANDKHLISNFEPLLIWFGSAGEKRG